MPPRNRTPRPKPAARPAQAERPRVDREPGALPPTVELALGLDDAQDPAALRQVAARTLKRPEADLPELTLLRKSIDARRHKVQFKLEMALGAAPAGPLGAPLPVEVSAKNLLARIDGFGPSDNGAFVNHDGRLFPY